MGQVSLEDLIRIRDVFKGQSPSPTCTHKLFMPRDEPCGYCSAVEHFFKSAIHAKGRDEAKIEPTPPHPYDDFPHMKLYAGCSECGGELQIEWKSAYTSSNSLGIQVELCEQCCAKSEKETPATTIYEYHDICKKHGCPCKLCRKAREEKKTECLHDNWQVKGNEFPGSCTCLDCGEEFNLCEAFNRLIDRLHEAKEKAKCPAGEPIRQKSSLPDLMPQRPATPDTKNYPDESEVQNNEQQS